MKTLYRYEISYKNVDDDTDIVLKEYPVVRETENCYFINHTVIGISIHDTKRVSKDAYNTFAYDTKEKAKEHFIRRTSRRIDWFNYWKEECEKGLELIQNL